MWKVGAVALVVLLAACARSSDPGGPVVAVQGVEERPCRDAEDADVCVDVTLEHVRGGAVDVMCELVLLRRSADGVEEVAASFGPFDVGRVAPNETVRSTLSQQLEASPGEGTWTASCSDGPEG
jgi:hypothetical protein